MVYYFVMVGFVVEKIGLVASTDLIKMVAIVGNVAEYMDD